jgi:hypothetical protein
LQNEITSHRVVHEPQRASSSAIEVSHPLAVDPSQSPKPSRHTDPHVPPLQRAFAFGGVAHALPQLEQLLADVPRLVSHPSKTVPLQSPNPLLHANPHRPAVHVAIAFARAAHAVAHVPQFDTELRRSTSHPFAALPSQSPNPAEHPVTAHVPATHADIALARSQVRPHIPQFAGAVERSVSHPFAALPSQSPNPASHGPRVHTPPTHVALACAKLQALPQAPQFASEVARSVSHASLALALQSPRPAAHELAVHVPPVHAGVPDGHAIPQPPQFAGDEVTFASHPFVASPSQFAKPALHAPSAHVPSTQFAVALAKPHT